MNKVEEKEVRDKLQDLDKDKVIELYLQKCFESDYLKEQLAITEKALELACEEADDLLIKSEGWIFGLCREGSFDKYSELEKKGFEIQGQCNYFKEKAKEIKDSE